MQNAVRTPKSSAFSLPAVYSREAEWLSRLCRSAGVLRMRILHDGRVRFCVCRPPKSKKRRFTLTSCVFCRVRAWMFRPSRQLAPKGHRTAARRRKLAQPRRRKPRYVMGNRLLFHFRLRTAGRQSGFPGFVGQPVRPECRISIHCGQSVVRAALAAATERMFEPLRQEGRVLREWQRISARPEQEVPRVRKSCILRVPASVVSPPASVVDLPVSGFQAHQRPLPTIQRILPSAGA